MTRLIALLLAALLSGCATKAPPPPTPQAPDIPADAPAVYSLDIRVDGAAATIFRDDAPIAVFTLPDANLEISTGEDRFDGGWVSPSFGVKIPAPRLSWRGSSDKPLLTDIRILQRPGSRA